MTPDMVSEVRVLTSSYEPEYGTTTGGEIIVTTRAARISSTAADLNISAIKTSMRYSSPIASPGDQRPKDNENEFGGFIGGPVKIPNDSFRLGTQAQDLFLLRCGVSAQLRRRDPPLVFHSLRCRNAPGISPTWAFPSTIQQLRHYERRDLSRAIPREPHPGNCISPLALQWMKYLPTPTSPGPFNNFLGQPVSDGILSNLDEYLFRIDHYWGEKDHFFATIWRQLTQPNEQCALPVAALHFESRKPGGCLGEPL